MSNTASVQSPLAEAVVVLPGAAASQKRNTGTFAGSTDAACADPQQRNLRNVSP
jgi:hypothetical protein